MQRKEIIVIPWKQLKIDHVKPSQLYNTVNEVVKELGDDLSYVYQAEFRFGEILIKNGKFPIEDFYVRGNDFGKTVQDFKNDLKYSQDPLGLVLENHVEIFTENNLDKQPYPILLNELNPGDFFGVFGALAHLTNIKEDGARKSHWSAMAGSYCTEMAYNWENITDSKHIEPIYKKFKGKDKVKAKFEFFKEFCPKDWKVKVVYFPIQFLGSKQPMLKLMIENEIFRVGWKQVNPLKSYLFDNKDISDIILKELSYKTDKHFLSLLYDYIFQVGLGERYAMRPINKNHVTYEILKNFRDNNVAHFNKKNQKIPLLFKYGLLSNPGDWGLVSMHQPPILYKNKITKYFDLLQDMNKINELLEDKIHFIKILCSIDGDARTKLKVNHILPAFSEVIDEEFHMKIIDGFTMNEDSISLTDEIFGKLIFVQKNDVSKI